MGDVTQSYHERCHEKRMQTPSLVTVLLMEKSLRTPYRNNTIAIPLKKD